MNTSAQCWKQNAPQTGVSEGRILLSGRAATIPWVTLVPGPTGDAGGIPARPFYDRTASRATLPAASMRNQVLGKLTAKTAHSIAGSGVPIPSRGRTVSPE
jgi:hypothetical protein